MCPPERTVEQELPPQCGDNQPSVRLIRCSRDPPPARGRHLAITVRAGADRATPRLGGGQRPRRPGRADQCGATPTGVGGDWPGVCSPAPAFELPPQMWGRLDTESAWACTTGQLSLAPGRPGRLVAGDLPADPPRSRATSEGAGSSNCTAWSKFPHRDHPRGCGEQQGLENSEGFAQGPSPRVRGAAAVPITGRVDRGTIPAGAGSRATGRATLRARRDHPRGCGEQATTHDARPALRGPSPRVRGAVRADVEAARDVGTIPAGAGSRP